MFSGRVTVVLTAEIIAEYARVVEQLGKRYPCADAAALLDGIVRIGEVVFPGDLLRAVCSDPDDDQFFACAVSGKARLIVSGDRHLLDVSGAFGVEVLTPRAFVDGYLQD